MASKPMHNKREFYRMCEALEKDKKNLTCHYVREGDKIEFIIQEQTNKERRYTKIREKMIPWATTAT